MEDFVSFVWNTERVFMVGFGQAASEFFDRHCPDVDGVGYHDEAFPDEHGPIVGTTAGQENVNVAFYRMEISGRAKLFAVSRDPSVVEITQPADGELTPDACQNIEFTARTAGRTAIEIRYNWTDGPILGRLYVQVYERLVIRMRLHVVSFVQRVSMNPYTADNDGKIVRRKDPPALFLGQLCPTLDAKLKRFRFLCYWANQIWMSHGLAFVVDDEAFETEWGKKELGLDTTEPSITDVWRAGALSANRSPVHVNVFCIPSSTATGIDVAATGVPPGGLGKTYKQGIHNACGLYMNLDAEETDPGNIGRLIAHEMGHYMSLCFGIWGGHATEDDTSGRRTRDDSVTRRRLMYHITTLAIGTESMPWRDDVGYGVGVTGPFVTYRRLPATQDIGFEESQHARNAVLAPGFYAF